MNGIAEVAKFADESDEIVFPPQRKPQRISAFTNGGYLFEASVLWGNPQLSSAVEELYGEYKKFEREKSEAAIAALEVEVDALIEGSQRAAKCLTDLQDRELDAMRSHQKAKDKLDTANEQYRQVSAALADDEGLFTRAQQAARDGQRTKASDRVYSAGLAESLATTEFNNAIQRKNQAANAAVAWEVAARERQSELKTLKRGRQAA
jgi:hypothetical protein